MKRRPSILIYLMCLMASTPTGAISRQDLIDCLRGVPVDVVCPV